MDRLLQNNTIVKVLASLLAILLWLVVRGEAETNPNATTGFAQMSKEVQDVAVKVLYDERNFSLVGEPKVNLILRGSAFDVTTLTLGDNLKLIADATGLSEGTHEVAAILPEPIPGITVDPVKVKIRLEVNVNKEVPVTLVTEGKPKEGLHVGEALINPKTVVLSGAKSAVESVEKVVANIPLDDAEEGIRTSVPLTAVDAGGKPVRNIELNRDRADVTIPITKPTKSVPLSLSFKGELAEGRAVESVKQTNAVTLYGPAAVLGAIEAFEVPAIDLTGLDGTKTFQIKLPMREGLTDIQPSTVEVTVTVVEAVQKTFDGIAVKVQGLRDGQSYALVGAESDMIRVTVEGAQSVLGKLTAADIGAVIDLTNQPAGQAEMRPQITTPNFVKAAKSDPQTLVVDVKK